MVREVAVFMQMYPAYTLRDVMNERAITFFTLLNEGYRLRYKHYIMLSNIISIPHMGEKDRKQFLRELEYASKDPSDILFPSTEGSSTQDIKKVLGG